MISPPKAPVLLVNPRSGGGKAQHHELVARCRAWGIEPSALEPGEDISPVATAAVLRVQTLSAWPAAMVPMLGQQLWQQDTTFLS